MSGEPRPVFVYGSLTVTEVLMALLRRPVPVTPGQIGGWRRCGLVGLPYPVIVADPSATTTGLVIDDLARDERELLDAFEGSEYVIVTVQVSTPRGIVEADAYAASDGLAAIAEPDDWDTTRLDDLLDDYVASCERFRDAFDAATGSA